nr:hypothetical protein [Tanacetum cinerariifolium]
TRVHIPAHDGSEAHNELPDLILSNEPKPLRKHRPPPPQSALINTVTAALPSPPLPPPIYIPSPVDRRDDFPKTELPPRKKSCLFTLGPKYDVGKSSTARPIRGRGIDYGFVSTLDAEARRQGIREAELLALREQRRRARQPGSDARVLDHQDASRDADSHI